MGRLLVFLGFVFTASAVQADNREEFGALDLTGDGKVSLAEAAGYEDVVVRFDKADRNRDGKLTRREFERLKKLKLPRPPKPRTQTASR